MKRDLNSIKCTIAAIESSDSNIERLEFFKQFDEILIIPNQPEIQQLIKQLKSGPQNPNPIYKSGKSKYAILNLIIEENKAFRELNEKALEKELTLK